MANTVVRTLEAQITADTSTFDVTVGGESRSPTGVVVMGCVATSVDNNGNDNEIVFGVSDFTDSYTVAYSDENNVNPTDSITHHQSSDVYSYHDPGTGTVNRTLTVAAIAGGVRFTPGESGQQRRIMVILVFGSACKAFTAGDSTTQDNTFNVAHGFATAPGAGFYGLTTEKDSDSADSQWGVGFHAYNGSTIEQAGWGLGFDNAVTTSDMNSFQRNDRVALLPLMSGNEDFGAELTAIDATNCTYTSRVGTLDGDLIGLLVECDDCEAEVVQVASPTTAASDWNFNGLSWEPQFVAMLVSRHTTAVSSKTDSNAGSFTYFTMDTDGGETSVCGTSLDNRDVGAINSFSRHRFATDFWLMTQGGVVAHRMDTFVLTSDGWDVAAADISDADSTSRVWYALAIEPGISSVDTPIAVPTGPLR